MSPRAISDLEGFAFSFFSNEGFEPPHVHVTKGDGSAKFWLYNRQPSVLQEYYNFKRQELKRAFELVEENKVQILRKWHTKKK
jgi:hypothetical protein